MHSSAHHYESQSRSSVFTKELTTLGLYEQHYSVVLYRSLEESFFFTIFWEMKLFQFTVTPEFQQASSQR